MSDSLRQKLPHPLPHIRPQHPDFPTADEVGALHAPAGKSVAALHDMLTETLAAAREVVESRYKGAHWIEAEKADRASVLAGEAPQALAALLGAEPQRYGHAVALANTIEYRLDAARARGAGMYAKALTAARQQQTQLLDDAAALAEKGWPQRESARGAVSLEDAQALVDQAQRLEAVCRWLDGTDKKIDRNRQHFLPGLDDVTRGRLAAFAYDRRGLVPMTWPSSNGERPADWQPRTVTTLTTA